MKPFEKLDSATAPDGTVLTLCRHDGAYFILAGPLELMSTRRHQSEEQLGELACAPYRDVEAACVLIGGLGLGFTLKAALATLNQSARVVVAELLPEIVAWYTNPAYRLGGETLSDARVNLRVVDVLSVIRQSAGAFDAILLDVDNGAEPFTTSSNAQLYDDAGIQMTMAALRPKGRIAYWLSDENPSFERALRRAGLRVETVDAPVYPTSSARHFLVTARFA